MRSREESNSERQKVDGGCQGLGVGNGELLIMGTEFQFRMMKKFWRGMVVTVMHNVNVLNVNELCTEKG